MTADDAVKLTEAAQEGHVDVRLLKYQDWLTRDITAAANNGQYKFIVDYSDQPLTDEFILKLQNLFIRDGFNIVTEDDPTKFRTFIINWTPKTNA